MVTLSGVQVSRSGLFIPFQWPTVESLSIYYMPSLFANLFTSLSPFISSSNPLYPAATTNANTDPISSLGMENTATLSCHGFWRWEGKFEGFVLDNRIMDDQLSSADGSPASRSLPLTTINVHTPPTSDVNTSPAQVPFNTPTLPSAATFPDTAPPSHLPQQAELPTEYEADEHSLNSSFDVSLVSGNSEDEGTDTSLALDSSFFSSEPSTPVRVFMTSSPTVLGLGISGLSKQDGSGPFTGLGVVSVRFSPWRPSNQEDTDATGGYITPFQVSHAASPRYDPTDPPPSDDSDPSLSSTFLQETLLTFTEDPFHGHTLASMPECDSYFEISDLPAVQPSGSLWRTPTMTPSPSSGSTDRSPTVTPERRRKSAAALTRNLSASTISSGLKRSGSAPARSGSAIATSASTSSFSPSDSTKSARFPSRAKSLCSPSSTKHLRYPTNTPRSTTSTTPPRSSPNSMVLCSPSGTTNHNTKPPRALNSTQSPRSPSSNPLRSPNTPSPPPSTHTRLTRPSSPTRSKSPNFKPLPRPTSTTTTTTRSPRSSPVWRF